MYTAGMFQGILEWKRQGILFVRREWRTMGRFFIVGGSSFAVKAAAYGLLSRVFWVDGPRSLENALALAFAMFYNFVLHRYWTFVHQEPARGALGRYLGTLCLGTGLDIGLFHLLHDRLGVYDVLALALTSGMIAGLTFFSHRYWTFRQRPPYHP